MFLMDPNYRFLKLKKVFQFTLIIFIYSLTAAYILIRIRNNIVLVREYSWEQRAANYDDI